MAVDGFLVLFPRRVFVAALAAAVPACTVTENIGEVPASVVEEEGASSSGTTSDGATSTVMETEGATSTGLEETSGSSDGTNETATGPGGLEGTGGTGASGGTTSWEDDGSTTEWTCETGCTNDCSSRDNETYAVVLSETEIVIRSGVHNSRGALLDTCDLDEIPEQCGPRSVVVRFTVPSVTTGGEWTLPHPDVHVELLADYRTSDDPVCECIAQGEPFEITEGFFEIDADDPEFAVEGMDELGLPDESYYINKSGDCG